MQSLKSFPFSRVLITGGAGFIGGCLVRRLLRESNSVIFNLDKLGYASDTSGIDQCLLNIQDDNPKRYHLLHVDLCDKNSLDHAIELADPDLVIHLAAESHVDRSIDSPKAFLDSNVFGTFNLLEAVRCHWQQLPLARKLCFRFHHVSTDEVFGSLGKSGSFNEKTSYDPRSPYSATKAASDHLVRAWHHTYNLPIVITNCSNNFGPWQFPEKLIPLVILKALHLESIPLYGDGLNVRDWLYVEDHVEALILVACKGVIGSSYCIGGYGERTNREVVNKICSVMDHRMPSNIHHSSFITAVKDRPGHDKRYSIDSSLISSELGWTPKYSFDDALTLTIDWYINNVEWCKKVSAKGDYAGARIGLNEL